MNRFLEDLEGGRELSVFCSVLQWPFVKQKLRSLNVVWSGAGDLDNFTPPDIRTPQLQHLHREGSYLNIHGPGHHHRLGHTGPVLTWVGREEGPDWIADQGGIVRLITVEELFDYSVTAGQSQSEVIDIQSP